MKEMYIYEPAMCCPTGLCGVNVDPELLRMSTVVNSLTKKGINIMRYNLTNAPQEFVKNTEINQLVMKEGVEVLPATVVDGKIVKTKGYPTNEEITTWLELESDVLPKQEQQGCCCEDGCCDDECCEDGCC